MAGQYSIEPQLRKAFNASRGYLLRKGASVWEAFNAKTTNSIVAGDGTDVTLRTLLQLLDAITGATSAQGSMWFRGASNVAHLAAGTANQILVSQGAGADVGWGSLVTLLKTLILTADGDILRRTAGDVVRYALGAANEVLSSDGTDVKYQSLATLIKNALLTADGDILTRASGTVQRLAAGTNGYVLTLASGVPSWAAPSASLPEFLSVIKTGDTSRSSDTSPSDDPDLTISLSAGKTYWFEIHVMASSASTAPDIKAGVNFGGTYSSIAWGLTASFSGNYTYQTTTPATVACQVSTSAGGIVTIRGKIVVTATGALSFYWSQNSSSASATVVRAGSAIKATQVG